jgi:presenilin-like A22 family membrane protease
MGRFSPGSTTTHWLPAVFLAAVYAVLAGLVIGATRLAVTRPLEALPGIGAALFPWQGLAVVVAAVIIGGVFIRQVRSRMAWELILGTTLFLGLWFYLWTVFSGEVGLVVASALTLLQAWMRRVWIHDVFILLGAAGVALNFAFLFEIKILLILLVGLAVYDTFAGRMRGVSARFAASLIHRGVIPGLVIPGKWSELGLLMTDAVRRPDAVFLGAGDLILPLLLVTRASASSVLWGAVVAFGMIGAAAWLGSRGPTKPFPALVPLVIGSGVPYLVLFLLRLV